MEICVINVRDTSELMYRAGTLQIPTVLIKMLIKRELSEYFCLRSAQVTTELISKLIRVQLQMQPPQQFAGQRFGMVVAIIIPPKLNAFCSCINEYNFGEYLFNLVP